MACDVDKVRSENGTFEKIGNDESFKNYISYLYQYKNNELRKIPSSYFDNKYLGLFFGASWCKFCVEFLDKLNTFQKNFPFVKIIYIPYDRTYEEYLNFIKNINFYVLPFNDYLYICKKYQIKNLPTFMIISPNNNILVRDGIQLLKTNSYVDNLKSLIKNYVIEPKKFQFNNRFLDLFKS